MNRCKFSHNHLIMKNKALVYKNENNHHSNQMQFEIQISRH